MSTTPPWMKYVGLPYRLGADPEDGKAADCVRMVFRVHAMSGRWTPPINRDWYGYLAKRELAPIMEDWFALTEQTYGPEEYAMTLLSGEGDFSIAIVVNNGLLALRRATGVTWVPLSSLPPMNYRRFIDG